MGVEKSQTRLIEFHFFWRLWCKIGSCKAAQSWYCGVALLWGRWPPEGALDMPTVRVVSAGDSSHLDQFLYIS